MRKDLAAYIRNNKLDKPVIVGHSLGGFMALWLAEKEPDLVGPLVIVDSLPFLAAVMQPGATAESVKPMAENMRKMFSGPPTDETEKQGQASIKSMVTKPEDYEMILGWSKKSDRIAEGNAMYDMMTTDLRADLDKITSRTIVIGTWIGYKEYGVTRDQVEKNFRDQYSKTEELSTGVVGQGASLCYAGRSGRLFRHDRCLPRWRQVDETLTSLLAVPDFRLVSPRSGECHLRELVGR